MDLPTILRIAAALWFSGAAARGAGPSLLLALDGTQPVLTWSADPDRRYAVETATAPAGPWEAAATIVGSGTRAEWRDSRTSTGPARFYRVADLGQIVATLSRDEALLATEAVPLELSDFFNRSAKDASDAVTAATQLTGSLVPVVQGTLRLTGDPARPVTYSPLPADRLLIQPVTGAAVELRVLQLDLQRNLFEWRQTTDRSDLTFHSSPAPTGTRVTARGTYTTSQPRTITFTVDLAAILTGFSEVDSSGSHLLSDVTVTGTLEAPGYAQQVQGRNRFELVSSRNAVGRLESASTGEVWSEHRLQLGTDTYVWANAKRQRSFVDGRESGVDTYWNATGAVTLNGAPFATLRKQIAVVGTSVIDLRFQLVHPTGTVDLEKWIIQVP